MSVAPIFGFSVFGWTLNPKPLNLGGGNYEDMQDASTAVVG